MTDTPASPMPPQKESRKRIGDILMEAGLITQQQMKMALRKQAVIGKRLGHIMVELGLLSEENMVGALSKQLGIPSVDLKKISVSDSLRSFLPLDFSLKHQVVPIERAGGVLKVAMVDPLDRATINDIEFMVGEAVIPLVASSTALNRFLENSVKQAESQRSDSHIEVLEEKEADDDFQKLIEASESPSVTKLISKILVDAVYLKASSLHIKPRPNDVLIRCRIGGVLRKTASLSSVVFPALLTKFKRMAHMDIRVSQVPQNGNATVKVNDQILDLRFSTLPALYGEKLVIRLTDRNQVIRNLDNLGMHPKDLNAYQGILSRPQGVVILAGPMASGISTTLYTSLRYLRSDGVNIVTLEDPIEYLIPGINQVQITGDDRVSFSSGLRAVLKQDVDIIMASEIRNDEAAQLIFQAALRGYLVLTAMHTSNVMSGITHILNHDIKAHIAASSIAGIVAQRLVRRNCPHCLERYFPEPQLLADLNINIPEVSKMQFYRGKGCEECQGSGYKGQIGIFEVLSMDYKLRELLLKKAPEKEIFQAARRKGMTTMTENGLYLVVNRITTPEEILRVLPPDVSSIRRSKAWEKEIISMFDDAIYV